ncbi:hypothetical protein T484DRAFT_1792734 [Baffinella frigidus]|nr:hypothetical protein T484DRAFT_1792734 [Cryptophyta sp. CCMP2293]
MAAASVPSGKVPGRAAQRVFCVRRSACICRLVALMAVVGLAEGFLTLPSRIPAGSASAQPGLCLVAERALPRVAARKAGGTSEAAVKLNPTREAAFLNMGCILEAQGQTGAALQAFLGALKANAKSSDAYALLARLMDRGGKRDAARQACEQALNFDGMCEEAHAPTACEQALALDGTCEEAHVLRVEMLAACHQALNLDGTCKEAHACEQALALDGACEEAHVLRVEMLRRDGSADASRRGVDALPSSARLRTSLATVFLDLGRASLSGSLS